MDTTSPGRPRRRLLVVVAGCVALAVLATVSFLVAGRVSVVDVDEAVTRYRSRSRPDAPAPSPTAAGGVGVGTSSVSILPSLEPSPGVYVYATTGHESANIPGSSRQYPPRTPVTVVTGVAAGCRDDTRLVFREHSTRLTLCAPSPGRLDFAGAGADVDFLGGGFAFAASCPPVPIMGADLTLGLTTVRCSGGATVAVESGGSDDEVTVEELAIPAARIRLRIRPGGDLRGWVARDLWISRANGIVLKEVTESRLSAPSSIPFRRTSYREVATFRLLSLQPSR